MEPVTRTYTRRLPASQTIVGCLAVKPDVPLELEQVQAGQTLDPDLFETGVVISPDGTYPTVVDVVAASPTRAYVLLSSGWWRIDAELPDVPPREEWVGELTPLPNPGVYHTISVGDLRIDDIMHASGLPGGQTEVRVCDLGRVDDGRGPVTVVRTAYGWFVWRQRHVQIAAL